MNSPLQKLQHLVDHPTCHLFSDLRALCIQLAQWEDALSSYQLPHEAVCPECSGPIELGCTKRCLRCELEDDLAHTTQMLEQIEEEVAVGNEDTGLLGSFIEGALEEQGEHDTDCGGYPLPLHGQMVPGESDEDDETSPN